MRLREDEALEEEAWEEEAFDDDGNLADDGMTARLDSLVASVLKTATMYRNM